MQRLYDYRKNNTSQYGEDGIIERIFSMLGIEKGTLVDVGSGGKRHSNTWSLMKNGWSGVFMDSNENRLNELKRERYGKSIFLNIKVEPNMLDDILSEHDIKDIDFMSIDIDGNDYYIWESLKRTPSVVLIEFNPCCKLNDYVQKKDGQGGSSLSMLVKLGKDKGYELIATTEINAFFVKGDLFQKFGIEDNSMAGLFIESDKGYGRDKTDYSK